MRVIICEDDKEYQCTIKSMIQKWMQINHRDETNIIAYSSSEDFLEKWKHGLKADILFLDIIFNKEMNGLDAAGIIRATDHYTTIVFITNFEAYSKDGYFVNALRYLSKPVCYEDIALCLDVAYKQYTLAHNEFLILMESGIRIAIRYEDIIYIEAQSPYVIVHLQNQPNSEMRVRSKITEFKYKLPGETFVQCHRSYIVNIVHTRCIRRNELVVSDGTIIPVSRSLIRVVNETFDSYYQEGGVIHVGHL